MRGIRLFSIAGVAVHLDWSLLIVFVLIVTALGIGVFPAWHPNWSVVTSWLTAFAAAILFFASVLLHELSHALMGRRNGIEIRRITLFVFGGMAQMEHEPDRWGAELGMAIVGPITSFVIGVACIAWVSATGELVWTQSPANVQAVLAGLGPAQTLLTWLGNVNLVLAVFNLVPAFPLDGGRVLRALLWRFSGDLRKATRAASAIGQGFAWLLIVAGIMMLFGYRVPLLGVGPINGIWLAFIGWFLNNAALMSYRQLLAREALEGVSVSRVMLTRFDTVDAELPLDTLVEEYVLKSTQRAFPVLHGAELVGMLFLKDLQNLHPEQRRRLRARDVMKPVEQLDALDPDDDALEALNLLAQHSVAQAPVVREGRIAGLVRREDILRWLSFQGAARARS